MNSLDNLPIVDIARGHMRFSTCTRPDSNDILFLFQRSASEAEVGSRLTPEERQSETYENVFGIVIHGKDCAKVIGEVIGSVYDALSEEQYRSIGK